MKIGMVKREKFEKIKKSEYTKKYFASILLYF